MIDKRVNIAKRLQDYRELLEIYEKTADNAAHLNTDPEIDAYHEGKAIAYRIALSFFEEYVEKVIIKKERKIKKWKTRLS